MPSMTFEVTTRGEGATGRHRTSSAEFWSVEQRMGGSPEKPNPLELLLGSLTGCMNVVLQMVAHEKGWAGVSARFRAHGELDPRGLMGDPAIPPYFHTVTLDVAVSGVPETELSDVCQAVGQRCPVHRLFEEAGVHVVENWQTVVEEVH